MARNQSALVNWSQYLAARGLTGFMQCFPVKENLQTAAAIASFVYRNNAKRRQRTIDNVQASFPEWSRLRADDVAERSFQHMFQLFSVDSFAGPRMISAESWPRHVEIGRIGPALDHLLTEQPAIMLSGHFGNWEMIATLLGVFGYPVHALARPIDNPLINRWILRLRQSTGTRIITKFGATPIIEQVLGSGGRIGLVADQNAGDRGLFTPFFGRLASSYKSIALLAARFEAPIVAGYAMRLGNDFRYRLGIADFIHPEDWVDQPDPIFYITARYTRAIEAMVRMAPEQYLWVHRRWKSRPRFEREQKPFPARLIGKLESLPWMTQPELDRIIAFSQPGGVPA